MQASILLTLLYCFWEVAARASLKPNNNGVIRLDDAAFAELTKTPREHYSVVLLTALSPEFNCVFCREFDPEFNVLADSWKRSSARRKGPSVSFGHLDFKNGQDTFRSLQLVSAPNLWVFPPTVDAEGKAVSGEPSRYDFTQSPRAEPAAAFISNVIGTEFSIKRPFDYVKFAKFTMSIVIFGVGMVVVYRIAGAIFLSKHFWTVLSLIAILIFNGGYMFTQIRNSPYSRGDGYIAGGFQDQFGAEVHIVAAVCMFRPL